MQGAQTVYTCQIERKTICQIQIACKTCKEASINHNETETGKGNTMIFALIAGLLLVWTLIVYFIGKERGFYAGEFETTLRRDEADFRKEYTAITSTTSPYPQENSIEDTMENHAKREAAERFNEERFNARVRYEMEKL